MGLDRPRSEKGGQSAAGSWRLLVIPLPHLSIDHGRLVRGFMEEARKRM